MNAGFVVQEDPYGQPSATCQCCRSWRLICCRCRDPKVDAHIRMEAPWGSNDSRADIRLCLGCYRFVVNAARREAGLPIWEKD